MAKIIITIGREYGSGGREIGEKLAERLGIPCYDKLIIDRIAKQSNMDPSFVEKIAEDQREIMNHMVYHTYYEMNPVITEPSIAYKINVARTKSIEELSQNGSCIIIGRASDYVLRNEENLISIFISADIESRLERIMERQNCKSNKAKKLMKQIDKNRADFYNFNTDRKWADPDNYDFIINSSRLGIDGTVEAILSYIYTYLRVKNITLDTHLKGEE